MFESSQYTGHCGEMHVVLADDVLYSPVPLIWLWLSLRAEILFSNLVLCLNNRWSWQIPDVHHSLYVQKYVTFWVQCNNHTGQLRDVLTKSVVHFSNFWINNVVVQFLQLCHLTLCPVVPKKTYWSILVAALFGGRGSQWSACSRIPHLITAELLHTSCWASHNI